MTSLQKRLRNSWTDVSYLKIVLLLYRFTELNDLVFACADWFDAFSLLSNAMFNLIRSVFWVILLD